MISFFQTSLPTALPARIAYDMKTNAEHEDKLKDYMVSNTTLW